MIDQARRPVAHLSTQFKIVVIGLAITLLLLWPVLRTFGHGIVGTYQQMGRATPRCFFETRFSYDPRREAPDQVFLAEPPEKVVAAYLNGQDFVIERVEVNHRSLQATVQVRLQQVNGRGETRAFRLNANGANRVVVDTSSNDLGGCYTQLSGWQLAQVR